MKKLLALALLAMAAFGMGVANAEPGGTCAGPVDAACTDTKGTADTGDDEDCLVYINGVDPSLDGCHNA